MAKPLTDDERAGIVGAIRAGKSRNDIARESGRSTGTVTRIANAEGLGFDRANTKSATEAAALDAASIREQLRLRWYRRAASELDRLDALDAGGTYRLVKPSSDGLVIDQDVTTAPEADRARMTTQAAIALDKALALDAIDDSGQEAAKGMLGRLVDGIRTEEAS